MSLFRIVQAVNLLWALSEVILVVSTRWNRSGATPRDRGSRTLFWAAIGAGIAAGTALRSVSAADIRMPMPRILGISLLFIVTGLVIRWTAILTLGHFFSTRVSVQPDHRLIRTGLFRWVRHPSYSGLLLLFLGMAFSFGNWLSFSVILVPFLAALLYRIRIEEASLTKALGQEYSDYCRSTKRLLPGVF